MDVPANSDPSLTGGKLELAIAWDHQGLVPSFDAGSIPDGKWTTAWPTENTLVSLKITGTDTLDGVYPGAIELGNGPTWNLYNNGPGFTDTLYFPRMAFPVGGLKLSVIGLDARFAESFNQSVSTIFPKPFASNEVTWIHPVILTNDPPIRGSATNASGFAIAVPEPSTVAMAVGAMFGLAAIRRRE
jgi:hypothetical protein